MKTPRGASRFGIIPGLQRFNRVRRVRVVLGETVIVDSVNAKRVLEISHPPVYYVPPADVLEGSLDCDRPSDLLRIQGGAHYFHVRAGHVAKDAAWAYSHPTPAFAAIKNYVAFYPHLMTACYVDDEQVQAQAGGFYGGWITSDIAGPFKGPLGTLGW